MFIEKKKKENILVFIEKEKKENILIAFIEK